MAILMGLLFLTSADGTWLFEQNGRVVFKLLLETGSNGRIVRGTMTKPAQLQIADDGVVSESSGNPVSLPVKDAKKIREGWQLRIDGDRFVFRELADGSATLAFENFQPWLLRKADGAGEDLASPLREYPPEILALRAHLKAMVKEDQAVRVPPDPKGMEEVGNRHLSELKRIFDRYGWVRQSLAGADASHDFWLLVQHRDLEFQLLVLPSLDAAVKSGDASMRDYAYLFDRVQTNQNKPQHWGTQVRCVKGKPALITVDDTSGLDARRRELRLQPIKAYLRERSLKQFCAAMAVAR